MSALSIINVTPEDALIALRTRLKNPSALFSWLDLFNHEHAHAFTVAKTAGYDVLGDIAKSLDEAISKGETLDTWSKKLTPLLQDKGWWGTGPAFDPETGATVESRLGSTRRLEIIYDTNVRQSYAAGRWLEIERNKADVPYLMYKAVHDARTRKEHKDWDGTCLPAGDDWWKTHYPPNGWNCRCTVVPVSQTMFDRLEKSGRIRTAAPPSPTRQFVNNRTGEVTTVPAGIDPGFAYNAGLALLEALGGGG